MQLLEKRYNSPQSALHWSNPWELLVATILSAQCTDERVNRVLPVFFRKWPGPHALEKAGAKEVEEVVYSTGFYRNKARNLRMAAERIVKEHGGNVPKSMQELLALPGVARKTANIVLFGAWGINEGVAVDTHVQRITSRLGLTDRRDPKGVENDLMRLFPQKKWGELNNSLVWFGREVCNARNPRCRVCELRGMCLWAAAETRKSGN